VQFLKETTTIARTGEQIADAVLNKVFPQWTSKGGVTSRFPAEDAARTPQYKAAVEAGAAEHEALMEGLAATVQASEETLAAIEKQRADAEVAPEPISLLDGYVKLRLTGDDDRYLEEYETYRNYFEAPRILGTFEHAGAGSVVDYELSPAILDAALNANPIAQDPKTDMIRNPSFDVDSDRIDESHQIIPVESFYVNESDPVRFGDPPFLVIKENLNTDDTTNGIEDPAFLRIKDK